MPLSFMHRQYIPSARMVIFFLLLLLATGIIRAATYGVTTPGQQTLTNRFLPYAGSGTQLIGNSPAWRDSAGVLGINNYLEGLETLTPGAAVNLNFSTWRTKRITLNQNTVFTAINIPSASTNVQTMLLEVIGDGAFTVSFANVTWQTPEITTPEAGVVTLYALRGDSGAVKGYTQAVAASGVTTINPTDGYLPYRFNSTTFSNAPLKRLSDTRLGWDSNLGFLLSGANDSIGIGVRALEATENPTQSVAIGGRAMGDAGSTADYNVAIGGEAGRYLQGFGSVIIGRKNMAASNGMTNNHNTLVGTEIGQLSTEITDNAATNSISLGYRAFNHGSSTFNVGNTNVTKFYMGDTLVTDLASYTGAGTLFLSDDGTYKAAGGGALWSSSSGNLTPSPAVDVVSIESQSANNTTNVALRAGSSTDWTAGATLQKWFNGLTNLASLSLLGASGNGTRLKLGENSAVNSLYLDSIADDVEFYSSGTNPNSFDLRASAAQAYLLLSANSSEKTRLQPTVADGSTPYIFGSSISHTSGNLMEVGNNGTNKVTVGWQGDVTANGFIAGSTNAVGALAGKVTGAASSTDNDLMTFSGTSGKLAKVSTSAATLGDASSATFGLTFNLSGASDPVLTAGNGYIANSGQWYAPDGSATAPSYSFAGSTNYGMYLTGTTLAWASAGSLRLSLSPSQLNVALSSGSIAINSDTILGRDSAARFQQGLDAASVVSPQIFGTADGSGTDKDGATKILAAGRSTGTGRPGDLSLTTGSTTTTSGSGVNADSTRFYAVSKAVDLTESTATAFQKFTLATNNYAGGSITATVRASDAAFAMQSLTSTLKFDAVNVGGTNVVTVTQVDNTLAQIPTGGTLTCTYDAINEGSNVFSIRANAASSLTQTALRVKWVITALNSSDAITVTPQ